MTSTEPDATTPLRDEADRRPVAVQRTVHEGMVFDLVRDTIDFAPGVRFDREYLRHTGAVLAAQTGAPLAELMGRLGHSTPGAAMRYQHAAADRDAEIARRLSALVSEPSEAVGQ